MDLQTAAERMGVHYQTAYRWVREGTLRAVKKGAAYEVSEDDLERFMARRAEPVPPPRTTRVRDWTVQVERLHRVLVQGDELGARLVVDRLHEGGVDVLTLCDRLFTPVLARLGDDWADGRLTVAEEHRASAICERLLARCAVHPRGRPRGTCVVATPPGEEHGLPAVMASMVLRGDRWQVHHLGTEVPIPDLVAIATSTRADLVVVSVVHLPATEAARRMADAVTAAGMKVLMGGPGEPLEQLLAGARAKLKE